MQELKRICGVKEVLPASCTLSGLPDNSLPPISGCVYEGTLDGSRVRIQRVRIYPGGDLQKVKEVRSRGYVFPFSDANRVSRCSARWLWGGNT